MEAHDIQFKILQECPVDQDPFIHAGTLLSLAEIGLSISSPKNEVQRNLDTARTIYNTKGRVLEVIKCDATLADLNLREGETPAAKTLFQQCIKLAVGISDVEVVSHCLEQLGDVSRWTGPEMMSNWTIVCLGHSMKLKGKRTLFKALHFWEMSSWHRMMTILPRTYLQWLWKALPRWMFIRVELNVCSDWAIFPRVVETSRRQKGSGKQRGRSSSGRLKPNR
jgi:hypothetical protein